MTKAEQKSTLAILERELAHGQELLEKGTVKPGQVKMWTGSYTALLRKFIGKENELSKCIPVPDDQVSVENANLVLQERVKM